MSELLTYILDHEDSFRKPRLPSLYSDLRVQKNTNPDGYAANIAAWHQALTHAARAGVIPFSSGGGACNTLVLQTTDELVSDLADSKYGRPMGLNAVMDEAVSKGLMVPLQEFIESRDSIYSKRWFLSPWRILDWGLRQVGLVSTGYGGEAGRMKIGNLVILANVEHVGRQVMEKLEASATSAVDRVMDVETFRSELTKLPGRDSGISDIDLKVLLRYLERDKMSLSTDGKTIKFHPPSSPIHTSPISQTDTTVASLKLLISKLTTQCTTLASRIFTLQTAASAALIAKPQNRTSALSALRSKKLAEKTLHQRSNTLHQLEEVLNKIAEAADQVEVVKVMQASAGALKSLNKQVGGVERVEDVIEDLREEMSKTDEVTQVINEGSIGDQVVDEDEVEGELERMEREEREKREGEEKREREKEERAAEEETRRKLLELEGRKVKVEENAPITSTGIGQEAKVEAETERPGKDMDMDMGISNLNGPGPGPGEKKPESESESESESEEQRRQQHAQAQTQAQLEPS